MKADAVLSKAETKMEEKTFMVIILFVLGVTRSIEKVSIGQRMKRTFEKRKKQSVGLHFLGREVSSDDRTNDYLLLLLGQPRR